MVTEKEEKKVFEQNLKDAIEEAKLPDAPGKKPGWAGIILGLFGLLTPPPFSTIIGFIVAMLGIYANHHGERKLGIACGILALINIFLYLVFSLAPLPVLTG